MSYQVLARKWRPRNFNEVTGQVHVVRALTNALENDRLHHAYLFTGTRGVGKTTLARIIAKCLNCETGITAHPCGQCQACTSIDQGRFVDLIEVDAASRTKVEDTRALLDNVQYAPSSARFKVYLIDEVHMLSGHSFNAFLKTLEEPPPHVKFLLATTDPQKLPVTVLSRCLQFHLKNLSVSEISQQLAYILDQEKIPYEIPAVENIAKHAQGSLRDALSILDQAIAFGNERLRSEEVAAMLGTISNFYLLEILNALLMNSGDKMGAMLDLMAERGLDPNNVLEQFLEMLHQICLIQTLPNIEIFSEDRNALAAFAKQFHPEQIQMFYQLGLQSRRDLHLAPNLQIGLEMAMIRLLCFNLDDSRKKPLILEKFQIEKPNIMPRAVNSPVNYHKYNLAMSIQDAAQTPKASIDDLKANLDKRNQTLAANPVENQAISLSNEDWPDLIKQLNLQGPTLALASHSAFKNLDAKQITLNIQQKHTALATANAKKKLAQALSAHFAREMTLHLEISDAASKTPAEKTADQQTKQLAAAKLALDQDKNFQEIVDLFDATIVPNSISTQKEEKSDE